MKVIIGIDPGSSGGIAWNDGITTQAVAMPDTPHDIATLFKENFKYKYIMCYLEKVGGYIAGKTTMVTCPCCKNKHYIKGGDPGSAMFKFGRNVGIIEGVLYTLGIPFETVPPSSWMKVCGCGIRGGSTKQQWKNKLKEKAQSLYPNVKVTLAKADALLIMTYGLRKEKCNER